MDSRGRVLSEIASVSHDFRDGDVIPEHFHPEHQLVYASAGVMTVHTAQGVWVVPPMRAVWIPARIPHWIAMSGMVSMRTLYLLPKLRNRLPSKCLVMSVSPLLRELILHACERRRLHRKSASDRRLIEIILDQLKAVPAAALQLPHPSDPRALRVVRALTANPADARTLGALCRDCGASKRTLERIFLRETRMTFGKWRQHLRLLRSMGLLASGEKVTTAAMEAGYASASAFIAMFRRELGTTPKRYLGEGTSAEVAQAGGASTH